MKTVVPFRPPDAFRRAGIDWTRPPATPREQHVREAYLTYECSCGLDGLVSVLLLARGARRQKHTADDLGAAADFAEVLLAAKLRKHQVEALDAVQRTIVGETALWQR